MSCPAGYTYDPTPRVTPFAAATETFEPGQTIKHWGGADIIWTKNHLSASKLEPLRRLGDPLADDALAALEIKRGEDALEALLAYTAQPSSEQQSSAPQRFLTRVMTVPDWVDWNSIQRGQQVYWRYCHFINNALLHYSFTSGVSMPKFMKVLDSTGYLLGKKNTQRITETAQFVFDVAYSTDYLKPGSGPAWKSIIQVRFLHAGVRARLSRISLAHPKYYNLEEDGVPINQEDQLATLFSLSAAIWRVMGQRMDVYMTPQEREDYLHLWRYIGYMMGVDDVLGVTLTPERAEACLESIVLHLADPDADSGRLLSTWANHFDPQPKWFLRITKAVGLLDPYKLSMALSEHLIGPDLWKLYELPSATRPYRVVKGVMFHVMYFDLWLVRVAPWWFRFRNLALRELQVAVFAIELNNRQTRFELKEVPQIRGTEPVVKLGDGDTANGRLWSMAWTAAFAALCLGLVLAQQG